MTPVENIGPLPWMSIPAVCDVVAALGANSRFVGGCVRDAVLGRPHTGDIDLATTETPDRVMERLEAAGIRALATGIDHGTVTAVCRGQAIEITTLRRDVETDGRHAVVAFTDDWAADAARRDFTMNALFCDADGSLYDPVGGLDDARAGRVRFVGDAGRRIDEDALRILRFFRFYAHYGAARPDPDAVDACRAKAALVAGLSGERIGAEMLKLLSAPNPAPAFSLMIETGVAPVLLPRITGAGQLSRLCAIDDGDPLRRLGLLLRASGDDAAAVAERLRLSNAQRNRLAAMTAPPMEVTADLDPAAQRRALYRIGAQCFIDLAYLAWAETGAPQFEAMTAYARAWTPPALAVGGDDVLALGIAPGPDVGRLLAAVESWWVDGDFTADREALLEKLAALSGKP